MKNNKNRKRYFVGGSEVTEKQARAVRSIGGPVVTERTDEWIRRYWK